MGKKLKLKIGSSMRVSRDGLESSPTLKDVRAGSGRTAADVVAEMRRQEAATDAAVAREVQVSLQRRSRSLERLRGEMVRVSNVADPVSRRSYR